MARIWKRRPVKDASRLAWHRITAEAVDRIRQQLAAKFEAATVNRALTALRQVLRFAWRDGSLSHEDYLRLSDVEQVRGEGFPRGRALLPAELDGLYGACSRDPKAQGRRDALAIALLHAAGLRAGEAASLRLEDVIDAALGDLFVRGKGGYEAVATLQGAAPVLAVWLAMRGRDAGPLLLQVRASGKIAPVGLCSCAVYQIVKKRAREAGLTRTTAHDLRRTYATSLLRAGNDHLLVMRALRHKDVHSLKAYDRRPAEEVAAAQRAAIYVPASVAGEGRGT
jgi:integrase